MEDAFPLDCLIVYVEKDIVKNVNTNTLIDDFTIVIERNAQFH